MTINDKKLFLHMITRTAMYIYHADERGFVNFIHGYEAGRNRRCDFTELSRQLLTGKYKISYSNDGWLGQIKRLAIKRSLSWVITFKQIALEIIADERYGGLDKSMKEILRKSIQGHIARMTNNWFSEQWRDEWLSLCSIKSTWHKQLWTEPEWKIINSIDKLVQAGDCFHDESKTAPSAKLISLKERFDSLSSTNLKTISPYV